MKNYYKILGVGRNATASEIKRAYRMKAKILHPDMGGNAEAFHELVEAYETLSDLKTRSLFDESAFFHANNGFAYKNPNASSFDYRVWLMGRDDDESRAKLIVFDLMRNNEDAAVAEFKRMNMERSGFRLSRWFTREDFMDYGFILAEELVLRREFYDAAVLLEQIVKMEYSYSYFKHFFPEVMDLARHVFRNGLEGFVNDELAIDAWERALEMKFGNADDAFFLLKMGDAYSRMGDHETAEICREEASRLGAR